VSRPRGDRARLEEARREGTRQRLIGTRLQAERVDELLAAFDSLPERHGVPWDGEAAFRWVLERRRR